MNQRKLLLITSDKSAAVRVKAAFLEPGDECLVVDPTGDEAVSLARGFDPDAMLVAFSTSESRLISDHVERILASVDAPVFYVWIPDAPQGFDGLQNAVDLAIRRHRQRREQVRSSIGDLLESAPDAMIVANQHGRIELANAQAERLFGYARAELIGQNVEVLVPEPLRERHVRLRDQYLQAPLPRPMRVGLNLTARRKDGSVFPAEIGLSPLEKEDGLRVISTVRDTTERWRTVEELERRAQCDAAIAELSGAALTGTDASALLPQIVQWVARVMDVPYCRVLELIPASGQLRVRMASGPQAENPSEELADVNVSSQAGYTLQRREPVVVEDFSEERRFHVSSIVHRIGIVSSLSVPIQTGPAPYGVLCVNSTEKRKFTEGDVHFLQTVANILATAVERNRTEQTIAAERNFLRTLINHLPDCVFLKDLQGRFLLNNDAHLRFLNVASPDLALGKTVHDFFPPEVAERATADDQLILESGQSLFWREERFPTPTGEPRWLATTKIPIPDAQGEIASFLGIARDITERKQAEDTQRKLASAMQQTGDHVLITNREGVIEYVNQSFEEATGYSASEVLGETPRLLKSGQHEPKFYERLWQAILQGRVFRSEFINRKKSGELYYEEKTITPVRNDRGEITHFISTGRDVTRRKQLELEMQKLAAFPSLNPNPVLELDRDGTLTYFNDAAATLARTLVKRNVAEMLPSETPALVAECLKTGWSKTQFETRVSARTLSWSFFPMAATQAVHCYVRDITEQLALEGQVRQLQKLESVGQLAGGVAHDFGNILTVVLGHCDMLRLHGSLDPTGSQSVEEINQAAEQAVTLIKQLLAFGRRQVIQRRLVSLNRVVEDLSRMLRRILGEDIALNLQLDPAAPTIHADVGMIGQVLMNLVVNARDAMPRGGRLTISTCVRTFDEECARRQTEARPGSFATLSVADTGCGIPPEILPHLFEPYFTTKEPGKGTGLGLATAYGIVKQHEGWITVKSDAGVGTAFEIFLPALPHSKPERVERTKEPAIHTGNETILLVEDEPGLRNLARSILERFGYRVLEASSGAAALEIWAEQKTAIAILITDEVMPGGMAGHELVEKLQAEKPGLKAIIISGYSEQLVSTGLPSAPGRVFLSKPFSPLKLLELIRESFARESRIGP